MRLTEALMEILKGNKEIAIQFMQDVYQMNYNSKQLKSIVRYMSVNAEDFDINEAIPAPETKYIYTEREYDVVLKGAPAPWRKHYNEYTYEAEELIEKKEYFENVSIIEAKIAKYCF